MREEIELFGTDGEYLHRRPVFNEPSLRKNVRARRNQVASLTGVILDVFNFYEWFCHFGKLNQSMSFELS